MHIHSSVTYPLPMAKRAPKKARPVWTRLFINEWLEALGLKAVQVCDKAGISESHLSLLAAGKRAYTQPMLEKLSKAMGIAPGALFHRPGAPSVLAALERLSEADRARAARMIEAMADNAPEKT